MPSVHELYSAPNTAVEPLHKSKALTDEQRKDLFVTMLKTREFDNAMLRLYRQGRAFGGVYSQIGHEAVSVGSAAALLPADGLFPMHRDLGAHFVRGQNLDALMRTYLAREGSMTRGTDGTGHYADVSRNIYGNVSHLAAMIPVAMGWALAATMRGEKHVALTYIGDGGCNVGDFHEAMNMASVQKLPLIVIIENNGYAYSTPIHEQFACEKLSDRALGYGCHGVTVDGNDLELVFDTVAEAVERGRRGEGPTIIEVITMRMRGHAEHDDASYVPKELLEHWRLRDPIARYEQAILEAGIMKPEDINTLRATLSTEMNAAIDAAMEQPFPEAQQAFRSVFVD